MGSMAPAALNKKPTSSHNNTPPETNNREKEGTLAQALSGPTPTGAAGRDPTL
ncbi:hypothetical protein BDA96_06G245200 [Sorghum bicolor]|uniref:Uncharacterized protein n=2 Tax=Sorghum bicolor TaxID=4558 RepID=A0A921QTV6_SORBI|nr:hypothetical protein SORBI_3006G223400 [Sorghum bicolor]KAG0527583.1 hypothetical protein BDA96_06G245200 [Sorghum bicolor]